MAWRSKRERKAAHPAQEQDLSPARSAQLPSLATHTETARLLINANAKIIFKIFKAIKNRHFLLHQNDCEEEQTVRILVHNYTVPSSPFCAPGWAWILGHCCQPCLPAPWGWASCAGLPHQRETLSCAFNFSWLTKCRRWHRTREGWRSCTRGGRALPAYEMVQVHHFLDDRIKSLWSQQTGLTSTAMGYIHPCKLHQSLFYPGVVGAWRGKEEKDLLGREEQRQWGLTAEWRFAGEGFPAPWNCLKETRAVRQKDVCWALQGSAATIATAPNTRSLVPTAAMVTAGPSTGRNLFLVVCQNFPEERKQDKKN